MSWTDWAQLAAELYGSYAANKGNHDSTKAQTDASQAAIDEQKRQFDLSRGDMAPWMLAGKGALGDMQALNGGDYSKFYDSPDYAYARDSMIQGMDRSAASHGRLDSGGYGLDLAKAIGGLASQNYNNYYNRLSTMAGQGQVTATGLGNLGQNYANAVGQQYGNMGQARASGYGYDAYNKANTATSLANLFQNWGK